MKENVIVLTVHGESFRYTDRQQGIVAYYLFGDIFGFENVEEEGF